MSYSAVKSRTRSRFNEVQIYLNYISSLEPTNPAEQVSLELKIQRGLFYVQLYAALEKSINDTIETTLFLIASKSVKGIHYSSGFSVVAFSHKLRGLKDSGYNNFFNKSIEVFEEARSTNVTPINEAVFATSLQNVWAKTIDEVYRSLGMKEFKLTARERATIDEIVDKRNAVAHGRESASVAGERHRSNILREKYNVISEISIRVIDDMETYFSNKVYLKPVAKKYYA